MYLEASGKKKGRFRRVSRARIFDGDLLRVNIYAVTVMVVASLCHNCCNLPVFFIFSWSGHQCGSLDSPAGCVVGLHSSLHGTRAWTAERVPAAANGKSPDSFLVVFRAYNFLSCTFVHDSQLSTGLYNRRILGHARYGQAIQSFFR